MMRELLAATVDTAEREAVTIEKVTTPPALEGSVVPAQRRRVLVCQGGPCIRAGAEMIWGHLRNEQKRLSLRTAGDGTMSAKTSCLGPCSLAPVLEVWPGRHLLWRRRRSGRRSHRRKSSAAWRGG